MIVAHAIGLCREPGKRTANGGSVERFSKTKGGVPMFFNPNYEKPMSVLKSYLQWNRRRARGRLQPTPSREHLMVAFHASRSSISVPSSAVSCCVASFFSRSMNVIFLLPLLLVPSMGSHSTRGLEANSGWRTQWPASLILRSLILTDTLGRVL